MASRAPKVVALGWGSFVVTHMVMSHPPTREALVKSVGGEKNFLGAYSAVAFITGGPLVYYYIKHGRGGGRLLWDLSGSTSAKLVKVGLRGLAAVVLAQSVVSPSPNQAQVPNTPAKQNEEETVHGLNRITRHGMFSSFALFGISSLIARVHVADLLFWGGFPAFYLIGGWHQDWRKKLTGKLPEEYFQQTSLLPFKAILEGRNSMSLAMQEMSTQATMVGLGSVLFIQFLPFFRRAILRR